MYNREILDELIKRFGLEKTILFCEMESLKNELLYNDCVKQGDCEPIEYEFEKNWWKENGQELYKAKLINYPKIEIA